MGSNMYPWGPHGPQSGPNQVTPNPTPAYVPPPASSGGWSASAPSYSGGGGGGVGYSGYSGYSGPRTKSYILSTLLTMIFGPFGLFYATAKGDLVLLFFLFGFPAIMGFLGLAPGVPQAGHPLAMLNNEPVMENMWSVSVFCSVIWSLIAVMRYNRKVKASNKAVAEQPAELPKVAP
jgi:hypothetical protein